MWANTILLTGLLLACAGQALGTKAGNVTFQLAARNLPKKDHITGPDSYVKLYEFTASEDNDSTTEPALNQYGKSSIKQDDYNPEWPDVFWFWWSPGTKQTLRFRIKDYDLMSHNDLLGNVDIDADALMQNPYRNVVLNLTESGGALIIKKTSPLVFKLRAENLPHKDKRWGYEGPSDPYVVVFFRHTADGADLGLAVSATITDEPNPAWLDVFEFSQYQPRAGQYLHFKVYDDDTFTADDFIGEATVAADELAQRRTPLQLDIGAKNGVGSLIVRLVGA